MAEFTDRWGLRVLGPGESLSVGGYQFSDADRHLIDRLLEYACETHRHTGAAGSDNTPVAGPSLTLNPSGGAIPSGARFYYRFTVIDALGQESAPSPTTFIDMPPAIVAPQAPTLSYTSGAGALEPGSYSYVLSAYAGASTLETKALNSAVITVPGTNPANQVSLILPPLPGGAGGYNVYRKTPTGLHYLHLATIANPAPLQVFTDNGSANPDCDRSLPATNTTSNANAVVVALPGPPPALAGGFSWRIYRAVDPRNWNRSLLTEVNPAGSPPATPTTFTDVGAATYLGAPPAKAQVINAPSKIDLEDGAEVQGVLPAGMVTSAYMVTFTLPGLVEPTTGSFTWLCPFDKADIVHCRAYLGPGHTPAVQDVIADLNAARPSQGQPAWSTVFTTAANRPRVVVGQELGAVAVPDIKRLGAGDMLSVDVDQAGGGATPTDFDLTVNVLLMVQHGPMTTWEW